MPPDYPPAHRQPLVEDLHGTPVEDPYRWLEDPDSEETRAWAAAQDALWREARDRLPGVDDLFRRLRELSPGVEGMPAASRDRLFFMRRLPDEEFAKLLVREPDGTERVLLDPAQLSADHTVTLDAWVPSKEGDRLAYKLSRGGDEEASLYVMDVGSGRTLEGPIDRVRAGSLSWLPGGEAYYYVRRLPPGRVPAGEERLHRRVWLHRIGSNPERDVLVFGEGREKITAYGLGVSQDGRWLLVTASTGGGRNDLYLADLSEGAADRPRLRVVQEGVDALTGGTVKEDGRLYLVTTLGAPRRRIVVTDPATPSPEHWRELIAEDEAVITDTTFTDDAIVLVRRRDVVSEITVHDRSTGRLRAQLPLPGLGSAAVRGRPEGGTDFWIGYTDFVTPYEVRHHDTATGSTSLWARPPGFVPAPDLTASQVFFSSRDGTRVPLFVVHRRDAVLDGSNPTILYGYGGFNIALTPDYSAARRAWVEQGGVYAIANVRGGSEYGDEWYRGGTRANKQNAIDDFVAAAEWLIAHGWTSPERLALSGGSNGGLLVGAALTQRPDLCRAVLCSAPVLDAVRRQRFQTAVVNVREYGDADVPEEFAWLLAVSPYHHVHGGTRYPAVLFAQGEADARVDPMHARKMCAALQWASSSSLPVLLRREGQVGHAGRSVQRMRTQSAETLAWLASQLGLPLAVD